MSILHSSAKPSCVHLTMCFRAAAGALVSRACFTRATASERAMVRVTSCASRRFSKVWLREALLAVQILVRLVDGFGTNILRVSPPLILFTFVNNIDSRCQSFTARRGLHIAMCLRVLRDALVSQVEFTSRIFPPPAVARYCKRKGFG